MPVIAGKPPAATSQPSGMSGMIVTVAMKVPIEPRAPRTPNRGSQKPVSRRNPNEPKKYSHSTGAVAEIVGYQSKAAFQRAFKSYMGFTPAQWRRQQPPLDQDIFSKL